MDIVTVIKGAGPLVLSMPHCGTQIPEPLTPQFNELGLTVSDTDWWIDQLYDFGEEFNATTVRANMSRYVVDLNRDPSGVSLYPGQATTGLCPTETFDDEPIYHPGKAPDEAEIDTRRTTYFAPYHDALSAALARAKATHGYAMLYDCHSIRSHVPRLFDGELPTVNIGTNSGASCAADMQAAIEGACEAQDEFSWVANGRFKGGWITRAYGEPAHNTHAVQVELTQAAYMMESTPWTYHKEDAAKLRQLLRKMLGAMTDWAETNLGKTA